MPNQWEWVKFAPCRHSAVEGSLSCKCCGELLPDKSKSPKGQLYAKRSDGAFCCFNGRNDAKTRQRLDEYLDKPKPSTEAIIANL